jgi:hypothetical protein
MSTDSHRERVTAAIRVTSRPLDDDQLAARTGISPRQSVNHICRELERAGMVRRRPGPDGNIVNECSGTRTEDPGVPKRRRAHPFPGRPPLLIPQPP